MNIQQQAEKEELESLLSEAINNLDSLVDNFELKKKISKREFDEKTQFWQSKLEQAQKALDILDEED